MGNSGESCQLKKKTKKLFIKISIYYKARNIEIRYPRNTAGNPRQDSTGKQEERTSYL